MKFILSALFLILYTSIFAQVASLPFNKVTYADIDIKTYPRDTSASALVLDEMGTAYVDDDGKLIFERYQKIKILTKQGLDQGTVSIPLYKDGSRKEVLRSVMASTYNVVNGSLKEVKMDARSVFTEDGGKYVEFKKFALPEVREGSVIEVKYEMSSPFLFNFRTWEFQSDIPKVHSEYWAQIPGNYIYNVVLRGYLRLNKDESSVIKDCFSVGGGTMADCALLKYGMDNVPAFVEEDYMTSKKNFISSVYFELSEIRYFDGRTDKFTKEWKDVDQELRQHEDFGGQIKKARNILSDEIKLVVAGKTDTLSKAKAIYNYIKQRYLWNEENGKYTDVGVKKAFETKKGNDADINLSLVGALQSAGVICYPVVLSTRKNGLVTELYPVMSQFNYVIAWTSIGGVTYLLDATSQLQPFGYVPMRCINGKGRLLSKESTWIDLKARDKQRSAITIDLTLANENYEGTFKLAYYGYDALSKRSEIISGGDQKAYIKELQNKWKEVEVVDYKVMKLDSIEFPLEEIITVRIPANKAGENLLFFNPFVIEKWEKNPFHSSERLYPVDFGAPLEETLLLSLHYPASYEVDEFPPPVGLALPAAGGRFLFNVTNQNNQINVTGNLTINKSVYSSQEYHNLKEFFARVVQIQQSQIVLKKK